GLRTDLNSMKQSPFLLELAALDQIDPLAAKYVLGGSRMGTKVLRQRWLQSTDPIVCDAKAYFTLPSNPIFWREVCDALSQVKTGSIRAEKIVADTKQIFALFVSTYHHTMMHPAKAS
ncbi:hypothetical protein TW80_17435, partial [Loktanella sp. S4079]